MISVFGVVSVAVALISVAVIVLHNRVMSKRAPVDMYFAQLEVLLRDRIEMLYHASPPDSELRHLCNQSIDLDVNSIIKALPDIDRATAVELHIHEQENIQAIKESTEALNQAIEEYNRFIVSSFPIILMARVLGFADEEFIQS